MVAAEYSDTLLERRTLGPRTPLSAQARGLTILTKESWMLGQFAGGRARALQAVSFDCFDPRQHLRHRADFARTCPRQPKTPTFDAVDELFRAHERTEKFFCQRLALQEFDLFFVVQQK